MLLNIKKPTILYILFLVVSFSFCQSNTGQNSGNESNRSREIKTKKIMADKNVLAAVMKDGMWGYIDQEGNYAMDARFPQAHNFSNGKACVNVGGRRLDEQSGVIGGKYTFIDNKAIWMGWQFEGVSHFYEGQAAIIQAGYAFLIKTNEDMLNATFDVIGRFDGGLAPARLKDKAKTGYIDAFGVFKIETDPSWIIHPFSEGLARVKVNGKWGFIDQNGEMIIDAIYSEAYNFNEGIATVVLNGKFGFINSKGEIAIETKYVDAGDFNEGLAAVNSKGKWGFINKKGEEIIPFEFSAVRDFHEGLAAVQKGGKVGYIKQNGDFQIDPEFSAAYDFSKGLAIYQSKGFMGYINKNGEIIIPAKFTRASNFVNITESNKMDRIN
jgi:hypothetical protein